MKKTLLSIVILTAIAGTLSLAFAQEAKPTPTTRPARPQPVFAKEAQMLRGLDNPVLNLTDDQKVQIKAKLDTALEDVVKNVLTAEQQDKLKTAAVRPPRRNPDVPAPETK